MMWQEFEEIAGYEVSFEDYNNIIEPMYMALPSVSKQDFVKMIDKKRFALPTKKEMVKEMKKIANDIFEKCGRVSTFNEEQELDRLAKKYAKRFYNLDWSNDIKVYVYFNKEYEYPEIQRGCTFIKELVIGRNYSDFERITLVKY